MQRPSSKLEPWGRSTPPLCEQMLVSPSSPAKPPPTSIVLLNSPAPTKSPKGEFTASKVTRRSPIRFSTNRLAQSKKKGRPSSTVLSTKRVGRYYVPNRKSFGTERLVGATEWSREPESHFVWYGPATKHPYVSKSRYLSRSGGLQNNRRMAHLHRLAEEEANAKAEWENSTAGRLDSFFDSGLDALFGDTPEIEDVPTASKSLPALKLEPHRQIQIADMKAAKKRGKQPGTLQYRENSGQNDVKVNATKLNYGAFSKIPRVLM